MGYGMLVCMLCCAVEWDDMLATFTRSMHSFSRAQPEKAPSFLAKANSFWWMDVCAVSLGFMLPALPTMQPKPPPAQPYLPTPRTVLALVLKLALADRKAGKRAKS